jgi:hypothetical protein
VIGWLRGRMRNPWGKPRFLVLVTWLYLAWALLPVLVAMLFSFNQGRSRSVWQGFRFAGGGGIRVSRSSTTLSTRML